MNLPPRVVSVLSLVQVMFVGMGFLFTRCLIRVYEVGNWDGGTAPARFIPPIPGFVASYGLWFFLVPLIWCVVAASRARIAETTNVTLLDFIAGIMLTIALAGFFLISSLIAVAINVRTP
jgi:hypothetical protein